MEKLLKSKKKSHSGTILTENHIRHEA